MICWRCGRTSKSRWCGAFPGRWRCGRRLRILGTSESDRRRTLDRAGTGSILRRCGRTSKSRTRRPLGRRWSWTRNRRCGRPFDGARHALFRGGRCRTRNRRGSLCPYRGGSFDAGCRLARCRCCLARCGRRLCSARHGALRWPRRGPALSRGRRTLPRCRARPAGNACTTPRGLTTRTTAAGGGFPSISASIPPTLGVGRAAPEYDQQTHQENSRDFPTPGQLARSLKKRFHDRPLPFPRFARNRMFQT